MTFYQPPAESPSPDETPQSRPDGFPPPLENDVLPPSMEAYPPPESRPRTNWVILTVVSLVTVCLSCSIIALSGLAGYNDGVNLGRETAQAGQQSTASRQCALLEANIGEGNYELGQIRANAIATLGSNDANCIAMMTQVNVDTPTPTASPSPTFTLAPTMTSAPVLTATATPSPDNNLLDPAAIFTDAQAAYVGRDWAQAIDLFDILRAVDETYQVAEVNRMLGESLRELSLRYLREPTGEHLAEGILLANRARAFGPIGELQYEAYIAGRYLEARNSEGMECLLSVAQWESVYAEAAQYRDVANRLFASYVDCANAFTYETEYCPAEQYFNSALSVFADSSVAAQRDQASEICAQATPTPTPTIEGAPETPPETPTVPVG